MKPQSVLTRVKMFENRRSASVESKKDDSHPAGLKVNVGLSALPLVCSTLGTSVQDTSEHSLPLEEPVFS